MKDCLLVIDVQNDFVTGSLGTKEAEAIVPAVLEKVRTFKGDIIFTKDSHHEDYLNTQEGKFLPVVHCLVGTDGWDLIPQLEEFRKENNCETYDKTIFANAQLVQDLADRYRDGELDSVTIIGLCTDICVVSHALMIKSTIPELPIYVDSACCAGVTPQKHQAALETMASCQIIIE